MIQAARRSYRAIDLWRVTQRGMMIVVALFAAVLGLIGGAAVAQAHAGYKSSNPAANSVLKTAPTTVSIAFLQRLSPQALAITVYDKDAKVVSTGQAQISSTDPYTATVAMKGDGSDIYRVDWNNVSAEDGDATLGAFVFGVDPSGATDKVPQPATTTTTTQAGISPLVAVLIGVAGLVIGAGFTFFAVRPRNAVRR